MCDEWANDYDSFRIWAESNGYDKDAPVGGCTLDRIDYLGNYEPNNCRWVTAKEQARNKSDNVVITYNGETKCLSSWCEDLNLSYTAVYKRIFQLGWTTDRALSTPVRQRIVNKKKECEDIA